MANSNSRKTGETIWSKVTVNKLVQAIASLGDRAEQLKYEPWRLKGEYKTSSSLWAEVIDKLNLDHNEKTRRALYDKLHSPLHNIDNLVNEKIRTINENKSDGNGGDIRGAEHVSFSDQSRSVLQPDPSLTLPQRPNTRATEKENVKEDIEKSSLDNEISLVFTAIEWKDVFSRTSQKMRDEWTNIFDKKIKSSGITCNLKFKTPYIKKGKRKRNCDFFCCHASCTDKGCTRKYRIILRTQPGESSSVLFLVRIYGKENHIEKTSRQLRGEERFLVGKRANEIGPLAVFRERIEAADERLLAAGNFTGCETIEVLKKAASDYC